MRKLLAAIALLVVATASDGHDYVVGQVWTYHVRPGDEGSTLQINKIDQNPTLGTIYHISVFGLRVPNPRVVNGVITELLHLPVSKKTLDLSVDELTNDSPRVVDYESGYDIWKRAFDSGQAGIYTISVADIVAVTEQMMRKSGQ